MNCPLRILLVDDHPFVRAGVRACLEAAGHLVCGEAGSAKEALQRFETLQPSLIVTDIRLGEDHGTDLITALQQQPQPVPCIVLSMLDEAAFVQRMFSLGASAYVLKDKPIAVLLQAIIAVTQEKQIYLSPALRPRGIDLLRNRPRLSPREVAVLRGIAAELSSQAIAEQLGMSVRTVESHRLRLRRKLHLDGTGSLLRYAQDYAALEASC